MGLRRSNTLRVGGEICLLQKSKVSDSQRRHRTKNDHDTSTRLDAEISISLRSKRLQNFFASCYKQVSSTK